MPMRRGHHMVWQKGRRALLFRAFTRLPTLLSSAHVGFEVADCFVWRDLQFETVDIEDNRIDRLLLTRAGVKDSAALGYALDGLVFGSKASQRRFEPQGSAPVYN